jgi:hypothetical protein
MLRAGIYQQMRNALTLEHYQTWLKSLSPNSLSKFKDLLSHNALLLFEHNKEYARNDRSWVQVYEIANANSVD